MKFILIFFVSLAWNQWSLADQSSKEGNAVESKLVNVNGTCEYFDGTYSLFTNKPEIGRIEQGAISNTPLFKIYGVFSNIGDSSKEFSFIFNKDFTIYADGKEHKVLVPNEKGYTVSYTATCDSSLKILVSVGNPDGYHEGLYVDFFLDPSKENLAVYVEYRIIPNFPAYGGIVLRREPGASKVNH